MKKFTILVSLALFIQFSSFSQSCLPQGITFTSQEEIDNFQTNYPNCTEIEGSMNFVGDNITNLDGLSVITAVGGHLNIGIFLTGGNPSLTSLSGLDNITTVGGDLGVYNNSNLTSLSGLESITSVGENLDIENNPMLEGMSPLSSLTSIGGYLKIKGNEALTDLTGLENITSIGWDLSILYNFGLTSLSGLEKISAESISNLIIYQNISLTDCAAKAVCGFLESASPGYATIESNSDGCNSIEEVEEDCDDIGFQDLYVGSNIKIYPNPAEKEIYISINEGVNIAEVAIYNKIGQKVLSVNGVKSSIDVSSLIEGVYVIELTTDEIKFKEKLIIR